MNDIGYRYLKSLGIRATKVGYQKALFEVPNVNSMYGISSLLNRYNIENYCVEVQEITDLKKKDLPCIVLFEGKFIIIKEYSASTVKIETEDGEVKNLPIDEFRKDWNKVVLISNPNQESKERDYSSNIKVERFEAIKRVGIISMIAFLLIIVVSINDLRSDIWFWMLMTINLAGLFISILLVQKQLHVKNRVADNLCGIIKNSHCEDVTNSHGSTIFGEISFSEIGFGFFSTNIISLVFMPAAISFLGWISLLVLPFSFWSLWFQKYKAKSWCVLCLIVLMLMWCQGITYMVSGYLYCSFIGWSGSGIIIALYILTTLSINLLIKIVKSKKEGLFWKHEYNSFKFSPGVMQSYLDKALKFDISEDRCSGLTFGNRGALRKITIFSNPYCGPCAQMHNKLSNIPWQNICINYVMTYFSEDKTNINKYIIAFYLKFGEKKTWRMLCDWYDGGKNLGDEFFTPYNLDIYSEEVISEFEKQKVWINDDRLYGTPMLFYNGVEIKNPYTVDDFMYNAL